MGVMIKKTGKKTKSRPEQKIEEFDSITIIFKLNLFLPPL
jgi:hypothetical protein